MNESNEKVVNTFSAGGVVLNELGEVLVVSQHGNSWSLPKGHIEKGEDELEAARREIYEESGIKEVLPVKKLGTYQRFRISADGKGDDTSNFKTITIYLFKTFAKELKPVDPENPEARWVPRQEVVTLLSHPKDKEFFASIINDF